MKNIKLGLIAVALAGLSTHALAAAPSAGAKAQAEIELEVVPTEVSCQININNGTSENNRFVWTPGLSVSSTGSVITDNSTQLKRTMLIDFSNPAVTGAPTDACDTAAQGITLAFAADNIDAAAVTGGYQGKIALADDSKWFNYAVAVNESAFTTAVDTAAGTGKANVTYPSGIANIGASTAIGLNGTNNEIVIAKDASNTDPDFQLGQYPLEIYLQQAYTGTNFPTVGATTGDNLYRGHFTITATYQ